MSIRKKALIAIGISLAVSMILLLVITYELMVRSVTALEQRLAVEDVRRVSAALENSVSAMSQLTLDWSAWDDAYDFVRTRDPGFLKSNLTDSVYKDMRFNLVMFTDTAGRMVYGGHYDLEHGRQAPLTPELIDEVTGGGRLLWRGGEVRNVTGIISTRQGPMIVAAHPITDTAKSKSPDGTLIIGRYISQDEINRLSRVTMFHMTIRRADDPSIPRDVRNALDSKDSGSVQIRVRDDEYVTGYEATRDIFGKNTLVLEVVIHRDIFMQGQHGAYVYYLIFLMLGLGTCALILIMLERVVLRPLTRLSRDVERLGKLGDLAARLRTGAGGELGGVASAINSMMDDLEATHSELMRQKSHKETEERYRDLVEMSPDAVFIVSAGKIVFINAAAMDMIGVYSTQEVENRPLSDFLSPSDPMKLDVWLGAGGPVLPRIELKCTRLDGNVIYVEMAGATYGIAGGEAIQIVARDETARKNAEIGLRVRLEAEKRISTISARFVGEEDIDRAMEETMEDLAELSDARRVCLAAFDRETHEALSILEWRHSTLASRLRKLHALRPDSLPLCIAAAAGGEVCIVNKSDGPDIAREIHLLAGRDTGTLIVMPLSTPAQTDGFLGLIAFADPARIAQEDIDLLRVTSEIVGNAIARKVTENKLKYIAYHDSLTGLPNRFMFSRMLDISIARATASGEGFAVMLMDLDRFKDINDTLGHAAGDAVLKLTAERLSALKRHSDFLARYSGDEFIAIIENVSGEALAAAAAGRFMAAFSSPFIQSRHEFFLSAKIGVCLFPTGGETAEDLIMNADMAMYRVKESGTDRDCEIFTAELRSELSNRKALENEMHRALERGEFELRYQPQIELETGRVVGAEALIRWNHPKHGLLMPSRFIHIAEDTGLIVPIGEWVLRTACEQCSRLDSIGGENLRIAVNLSSKQFLSAGLMTTVTGALVAADLDPTRLELEVTESTAMRDVGHTVDLLREFKGLGVRLSIDDFGTGYSSLSYLRSFPVDTVKIAGAFLRDVLRDPDSDAMVEAIITMAHSLKRKVIAEEVETAEQVEFLRGIGCDEAQGFFFSKPLRPADLEALISDGAHFDVEPNV